MEVSYTYKTVTTPTTDELHKAVLYLLDQGWEKTTIPTKAIPTPKGLKYTAVLRKTS